MRQISRISALLLGWQPVDTGGEDFFHLDPLPGLFGLSQRFSQPFGHESVVVHGDVDDVRLVRGERAQRADVRRPLGDHDVAGVAEDPGHHVEAHLRADAHHDVVRMRLDALQSHDFADLVAQQRNAVRRAVLQRDQPVLGDQLGHLRGQRVQRQRGEVRHATRERDDLGPAREFSERVDHVLALDALLAHIEKALGLQSLRAHNACTAAGSSYAPGTFTTVMSSSAAPCRSRQSMAPSNSRSVIKLLVRAMAIPKRAFFFTANWPSMMFN